MSRFINTVDSFLNARNVNICVKSQEAHLADCYNLASIYQTIVNYQVIENLIKIQHFIFSQFNAKYLNHGIRIS